MAFLRGSRDRAAYSGPVEVLLWLVPAVVATTVAALWASYAGRVRDDPPDQEAQLARIGKALQRELPRRAS